MLGLSSPCRHRPHSGSAPTPPQLGSDTHLRTHAKDQPIAWLRKKTKKKAPQWGRGARRTWRRAAALQRRQEWTKQQRPGQAGPLGGHQEDGPGGHALVLLPSHRLSEAQQLEYLQPDRPQLKGASWGSQTETGVSSPVDTRWHSRRRPRLPAGGRSPGPWPRPRTSSNRTPPLKESERQRRPRSLRRASLPVRLTCSQNGLDHGVDAAGLHESLGEQPTTQAPQPARNAPPSWLEAQTADTVSSRSSSFWLRSPLATMTTSEPSPGPGPSAPCSHLFGTILESKQLLDNNGLVDVCQEASECLLTSATLLGAELQTLRKTRPNKFLI